MLKNCLLVVETLHPPHPKHTLHLVTRILSRNIPYSSLYIPPPLTLYLYTKWECILEYIYVLFSFAVQNSWPLWSARGFFLSGREGIFNFWHHNEISKFFISFFNFLRARLLELLCSRKKRHYPPLVTGLAYANWRTLKVWGLWREGRGEGKESG